MRARDIQPGHRYRYAPSMNRITVEVEEVGYRGAEAVIFYGRRVTAAGLGDRRTFSTPPAKVIEDLGPSEVYNCRLSAIL